MYFQIKKRNLRKYSVVLFKTFFKKKVFGGPCIWYYIQFWYARRTYQRFPLWIVAFVVIEIDPNCIIFVETRFPGTFILKYKGTCCIKNDHFITKILFNAFTCHLICKKPKNAQHFWEITAFFVIFLLFLFDMQRFFLILTV